MSFWTRTEHDVLTARLDQHLWVRCRPDLWRPGKASPKKIQEPLASKIKKVFRWTNLTSVRGEQTKELKSKLFTLHFMNDIYSPCLAALWVRMQQTGHEGFQKVKSEVCWHLHEHQPRSDRDQDTAGHGLPLNQLLSCRNECFTMKFLLYNVVYKFMNNIVIYTQLRDGTTKILHA